MTHRRDRNPSDSHESGEFEPTLPRRRPVSNRPDPPRRRPSTTQMESGVHGADGSDSTPQPTLRRRGSRSSQSDIRVVPSGVNADSDIPETRPRSSDSIDGRMLDGALASIQVDRAYGRYEIGQELGRGGMGVVVVGNDPRLRRDVAIKRLRSDRADRNAAVGFIEEAQITAQLEHPGIVPVHEIGSDSDGRPWLAMKRVSGRTLDDAIRDWHRESPRLTPAVIREMLTLFDKVADAIAFAHDRGVVHRDLKADNVMVGRYGEVLVMDWGLARPLGRRGRAATSKNALSDAHEPVVTDRRDESPDVTMDGDVFGTPSCMAPEQARGDVDQVDERTDVFGLGGLLYHMFTGELPYRGDSIAVIISKALRHDLPTPAKRAPQSGVPRELSAIVMKAMAFRSEDRYPTVPALQADLAAYLDYRPISALRDGLIRKAAKWVRRHPMATMASTLVLVFIVALGGVIAVMQAEQARAAAEQREKQIALEQETAAALHAQEQAELRAAVQADDLERARQILRTDVETARDKALQDFTDALGTVPWEEQRGFVQALGPTRIQQLVAAYNRLFKAHEAAPEQIPVTNQDRENRGLLHYFGTGDFEAAIVDFSHVLGRDPDDKDSLIYRGFCYEQLGRRDEALADYNRGLKVDPESHNFWISRAGLLLDMGRVEEAMRDYDQGVRLAGSDPVPWTNRGVAWYRLGQYDKAVADHTQALRIAPQFAGALHNRACALEHLGRTAEAMRDVNEALRIDAAYPLARLTRARLLRLTGDWQGVIRDATEALRSGEYPQAYVLLGLARYHTGDMAAAIRHFERGIRQAGDADAWFRYGHLLMQSEMYPEAIGAFSACLEQDDGIAEALVNRGICHRRTNDNAAALDDFREASRINPNLQQAWFNQGIVLCDLKRIDGPDGARAAFEKAISVAAPAHRDGVRERARRALQSAGAE